MTERERLIDLLRKKCAGSGCKGAEDIANCENCENGIGIADYLLADGAIAPGCKVDDFLYKPKKVGPRWVVVEYVITAIMSIEKDEWIIIYRKARGRTHHQCSIDEIGKTVFLSRKEAEQKLKGDADE